MSSRKRKVRIACFLCNVPMKRGGGEVGGSAAIALCARCLSGQRSALGSSSAAERKKKAEAETETEAEVEAQPEAALQAATSTESSLDPDVICNSSAVPRGIESVFPTWQENVKFVVSQFSTLKLSAALGGLQMMPRTGPKSDAALRFFENLVARQLRRIAGSGAAAELDSLPTTKTLSRELLATKAELAVARTENARLAALLRPHAPRNLRGTSLRQKCATVWWNPSASRGLLAFTIVVGAVDEATGERVDELTVVESDAVGVLIDDPRLAPGRQLRFYVTATGVNGFSSNASTPSEVVTISTRWSLLSGGGAALLSPKTLVHDDACLAGFMKNRKWSSAQHRGVMRSLFTRGIGLLLTPRLVRHAPLASSRLSPALLRSITRFAMSYATPTKKERSKVVAASACGADLKVLKQFLRNGVDPNFFDVDGFVAKNATLLHIASLHGATECVRTLLAAGADVDAEYGGLGGDLDQTKKKKGSTSKCSSGCTALVLAAHSHHLGTMKALLNAGAGVGGATLKMPSTTAEQRSRNDIANAALYYAAASGGTLGERSVLRLISAGADIDAMVTRECGGACTALYIAAQFNRVGIVAALLNAGAAPDRACIVGPAEQEVEEDADGEETESDAEEEEEEAEGAETESDDDRCGSARKSSSGSGSSCNSSSSSSTSSAQALRRVGDTPLGIASRSGHSEIVELLLSGGADARRRGWLAATPLEAAQRSGHDGIVTQLQVHLDSSAARSLLALHATVL